VVVASGLYAAAGPSIPIELGVCALGATLLTSFAAPELRKRNARLAARLQLSEATVDSALRSVYLAGYFVVSAALLGIGCFLGGSLGALA
jgi:hypothetical protein